MAYAIISDIHSNIEALTNVLADIKSRNVDKIVCLGDVVGYGPNPIECTDLIMENCDWTLKGNHDEALIHGAYAFNMRAQKAIEWTKEQLKPRFFSGSAARRRWEFLSNLELRHEEDGVMYIHGSPRDATNEYILATEIGFGRTDKFEEIFDSFEKMLFVGHTHLPCVITDKYESTNQSELDDSQYVHKEGKAIINVGSVGQPRDRNNRSCYVTVDGDTIRWHRVEYEFEKTMEKINKIPALDPALGSRLKEGV